MRGERQYRTRKGKDKYERRGCCLVGEERAVGTAARARRPQTLLGIAGRPSRARRDPAGGRGARGAGGDRSGDTRRRPPGLYDGVYAEPGTGARRTEFCIRGDGVERAATRERSGGRHPGRPLRSYRRGDLPPRSASAYSADARPRTRLPAGRGRLRSLLALRQKRGRGRDRARAYSRGEKRVKIQILSDLHLEHHRDYGEALVASLDLSEADLVILAGDIVDFGVNPFMARARMHALCAKTTGT